ncbi:proline-rich protein 2-like isoform X2 [Bubalus bubalis]|uniref:proline-rich protein 2-like isoform X2 n=1 Tax=Bubalus bubalis TaxID=89462 RepID=UPI001D12751E|nr:proline-rich protein 2-like isoform X2 [Bubalus bubalis]
MLRARLQAPHSKGAARETEARGTPRLGGLDSEGRRGRWPQVTSWNLQARPPSPPAAGLREPPPETAPGPREPPVSTTTGQAWPGRPERRPACGPNRLGARPPPRGLAAQPTSATRSPGRHGATPAAASRAPLTHLQRSPPPPRSRAAPTRAVGPSPCPGPAHGATPPAGRPTDGAVPRGRGKDHSLWRKNIQATLEGST